MKSKIEYVVLVVACMAFGVGALAGKQASNAKLLYLLKAGSETVAELRVRGNGDVAIEATSSAAHAEYDYGAGTVRVTGGAILKLTSGTNSISVRADGIESVPDSK